MFGNLCRVTPQAVSYYLAFTFSRPSIVNLSCLCLPSIPSFEAFHSPPYSPFKAANHSSQWGVFPYTLLSNGLRNPQTKGSLQLVGKGAVGLAGPDTDCIAWTVPLSALQSMEYPRSALHGFSFSLLPNGRRIALFLFSLCHWVVGILEVVVMVVKLIFQLQAAKSMKGRFGT